MNSRFVRWSLALFALILCASAADAQTPKKMNVLFIMSDDMRPELGCYGHKVIRTPNMQKMLAFYRDVVELEPFKVSGTMHFLRVSEGLAGQAQAIGLFELNEVSDVDDTPFDGHDTRKTPFHHFAFIIDLASFRCRGALRVLDREA